MIHIALCALNARYSHTSLAIRSLAAQIRIMNRPDIQLTLYEWTINDRLLPLLQRLDETAADVYAFSCSIWNSTLIRTLSRELKKIRPEALILWGGPEAGIEAEKVLKQNHSVDCIIFGEGEATLTNLLCVLADKRPPESGPFTRLPGLAWRDPVQSVIRVNRPAPLLSGDDWPFPYRDEDLRRDRERILYYESSRGCPFRCSYCLSSLDRTLRDRSLDKVLSELDRFIAADVRQVKFVDRTFNCRPERACKIWQYLIEQCRERSCRTNFHFELAGDLLDDTSLDILETAPAGLFQFEIGVQSIHPAVLQAVNRTCDLDVLARQVTRLRRSGNCRIHLDLIAGLPGENLERFSQSFDWVYRLAPHHLQIGFLKVLPGTEIARTARERNYRWLDDPPYEVLQTDLLSFAELCRLKRIGQLLDLYGNSSQQRAAAWLCRFWSRPWSFYTDLAVWFENGGLFDPSLNPEARARQLHHFALASKRLSVGQQMMFLDLLRIDYQLGGQKSQPEWLAFWELYSDPQAKALLRSLSRQAEMAGWHRRPGRLRFERVCFDWDHYDRTGDLRSADWLLVFDWSQGRPDICGHGPFAAGLPLKPGGAPAEP